MPERSMSRPLVFSRARVVIGAQLTTARACGLASTTTEVLQGGHPPASRDTAAHFDAEGAVGVVAGVEGEVAASTAPFFHPHRGEPLALALALECLYIDINPDQVGAVCAYGRVSAVKG